MGAWNILTVYHIQFVHTCTVTMSSVLLVHSISQITYVEDIEEEMLSIHMACDSRIAREPGEGLLTYFCVNLNMREVFIIIQDMIENCLIDYYSTLASLSS